MASTNIRVDVRTHAALRELADQQHRPVGKVVFDAVEQYREDIFWREMEDGLAMLKADSVAWKDYQDEIALWDTASGDGLQNEEPYAEYAVEG